MAGLRSSDSPVGTRRLHLPLPSGRPIDRSVRGSLHSCLLKSRSLYQFSILVHLSVFNTCAPISFQHCSPWQGPRGPPAPPAPTSQRANALAESANGPTIQRSDGHVGSPRAPPPSLSSLPPPPRPGRAAGAEIFLSVGRRRARWPSPRSPLAPRWPPLQQPASAPPTIQRGR